MVQWLIMKCLWFLKAHIGIRNSMNNTRLSSSKEAIRIRPLAKSIGPSLKTKLEVGGLRKVRLRENRQQINCYCNVAAKIRESGGSRVLGWMFWDFNGLFLEVTHHAIWCSADGKWVDVTKGYPSAGSKAEIVFGASDLVSHEGVEPLFVPCVFVPFKDDLDLAALRVAHESMIDHRIKIWEAAKNEGAVYDPIRGILPPPAPSKLLQDMHLEHERLKRLEHNARLGVLGLIKP